MAERLEKRYCIKFCQKLGDSQMETIRKIQTAFGDDAMSSTQIEEWYNRFKDGRTLVESKPRSGRPSTCRNDQVSAEVNAVGIFGHEESCSKIRAELLMVEQKQLRVEVSQDMLDSTNSDPDFMNTIITGDESWVYGYDPETKSESSQ
ncbi:protein GVQW3-like [Dermacentor albipictus]|uniref:protein GVQW3-like n=1 Tax=Dermacentor albipictus TaxID=60249 RepID=UPI0031FE361E